MSRADGILHLVLADAPYADIEAGRKPVEYRGLHWFYRIVERIHLFPGPVQLIPAYTWVRFQRGYRKDPGTGRVPTMLWEIDRVDQGPSDPQWTYGIVSNDQQYLRIWLGKRIDTKQANP